MFDYIASAQNVLATFKCGCGVGWVKMIENNVTQLFTNAKSIKSLNPACKQVSGVAENLL